MIAAVLCDYQEVDGSGDILHLQDCVYYMLLLLLQSHNEDQCNRLLSKKAMADVICDPVYNVWVRLSYLVWLLHCNINGCCDTRFNI